MKLKRCLSLVLALLFAVGLVHLSASDTDAGNRFSVSLGFTTDYYVYAPGIFDIYVVTDAEEPTYRWYARFSGSDYYVELVDNEHYAGTKTHHLALITSNGNAYDGTDNGWNAIGFTCLVTDKNGVSLYSPDVHMIILSHESLLEKLEKNGVRFSSFGVTNASASREIDGVTYYDVVADSGVSMTYTYGVLENDDRKIFDRSEAQIKVERFVTEGQKTVEYADSMYYPNKLGNGALTVTGNLVLYMRGQRMETIDTKTYVVNVLAPEGIGAATTKSAAALQDSMSFHPVTLTNVPAGTYVRLLEDKGSFWKVAVNGYMGYISATSLNVMENIGAVSVSVPEPVAYAKADNAVTLEPGAGYRADPQKNQQIWYDRTANRFLDPGDSFLPGHQYRVNVWLSADAGKRFVTKDGKPSVSSFVNGMTAKTNKAYEQDPEEVIEVAFDFDHVHDLKKVNRVYPTCTTAGKEYHYECSCGWRFEDAAGKVKITDENWGIIPALGHRESAWSSNGTQHYKVCQRRECGETLPETKGAHTGGTATCEHGAYCDVCGLEYGAKVSHKWSEGWDYRDASGHAHFCAYLCGTHSEIKPHRPGKEATATEPQVCLDCGYVIKEAGSHTHSLKKVSAKSPTCVEPGTKEHWVCSGCGAKFSDEKGSKPVTDENALTVAPLGHSVSDAWKSDSKFHWRTCTRCGQVMDETKAAHSDTNNDYKCDTCAYKLGSPATSAPSKTSAPATSTKAPATSIKAPETSPATSSSAPVATSSLPASTAAFSTAPASSAEATSPEQSAPEQTGAPSSPAATQTQAAQTDAHAATSAPAGSGSVPVTTQAAPADESPFPWWIAAVALGAALIAAAAVIIIKKKMTGKKN